MKRISLVAAFIVALLLFSPVYAQGRTGAVCRDGTTSGATGRGACSHHGGVDHWITSEPEATPTFTPAPTVAPLPTATPSPVPTIAKKTVTILRPTSTAAVTATGAISGTSATVLRDANLRSGPGTSYAIAGAAKAGQVVTIVGQNSDASWYHLAGGQWIAAFLVEVNGAAQPTATLAASAGAAPTATTVSSKIDYRNDPVALAYASGLQNAMSLYAEGSQIVSEQATDLSSTPGLLISKAWQSNMITGLAELKLCSQAIRDLKPPTYLAEIHTDLLSMADHLDNAVDLWANGIDNVDITKVTAGTNEYRQTVAIIQSSTEKIKAFAAANSD